MSFIGLTLALLSACSTTQEKISQAVEIRPVISPTIAEVVNKSLKRVVAIGRFSDETKRGGSFLFSGKSKLGQQASDILAARLTGSGKFILLERQDLSTIIAENSLNKVAADFIILGSVSEFGRSTVSEVGVFSRNKIQIATATVNIRLVNTKTGEIVYSEEATGESRVESSRVLGVGERAAYNTKIDDKALSAAISKLTSNIIENLMDSPWQAYIVSDFGSGFLMTGGENQGVNIGDKFSIVVRGKTIKNPQTGLQLELPGENIALVKVLKFIGQGDNALSYVEITQGIFTKKQLNDVVVREIKD
ncbi:MAG: curli production assembly protein CsgG [Gammaproteobacteria bacterium]|nr:curli production assembly protein CsgG [Gammaproteobacteria bacterium]